MYLQYNKSIWLIKQCSTFPSLINYQYLENTIRITFFHILIGDKTILLCKIYQWHRKVWRKYQSKQHGKLCPNTNTRYTVKETVVNILVLCCSNKKLLIYDQMTNHRQKNPESSKHVVTSCVWVFTWWEPQNTVKSIRSHWPTRRWWGLFCYWKNMGHFSITRTILILVSPLVNPQFHQWLAGRNGWQAAVSMSICGKLPLA